MNQDSLYDLSELKKHIPDENKVSHYIADFIVNVAEECCNNVLGNYLRKDKEQTKQHSEKLRMSLSMYGIHSLEKEIDKLSELLLSSDNYDAIFPVIQKIKSHLRLVKNQMLQDFKMVITLVN